MEIDWAHFEANFCNLVRPVEEKESAWDRQCTASDWFQTTTNIITAPTGSYGFRQLLNSGDWIPVGIHMGGSEILDMVQHFKSDTEVLGNGAPRDITIVALGLGGIPLTCSPM
jgi:hypothetical protein